MKFKILEVPDNSDYRGVERTTPSGRYLDYIDERHPVSEMFFWHVYAVNEFGILQSPANATRLIKSYQTLDTPIHFELIEITEEGENPSAGTEFLGYDLASNFNLSLLTGGLRVCDLPLIKTPSEDIIFVIMPLLCLVERFFRPQLNSNGLFDSAETANYCLECLIALQKIRPNLFENDQFIFNTIGIWKVLHD